MSELVAVRNRNKYPLSFGFKPINRASIRKGEHYLVFPSNVYPFKYYELELFVTPTPNANGIVGLITFGKTYRVTDKITGYWFGKDWETPEKAKAEAIITLRRVNNGKTNYRRALENIGKFDWNEWQDFTV